MRADHVPAGNPCVRCGSPAAQHRIDHQFQGEKDNCERCGWPFIWHRNRERTDNRDRTGRVQIVAPRSRGYAGVDGEGQGRLNHRYVLLAASDETGKKQWHVENPLGLTTEQCLRFLFFGIPKWYRCFSFSFNYDLSKMLQDLDEKSLYYLFRPELRQRYGREAIKGPYPVRWNGWYLNLQGTKFSCAKVEPGERKKDITSRVIWDVWKFYQCKFTEALETWKVGEKEDVEFIKLMKDKRDVLDREKPEKIRQYCFKECMYMAQLAHKLDDAHKSAGLRLKSYYGAGSSATAMLLKMGVKDFMTELSEEMRTIVASAFFGGRFDNSFIGPQYKTVYNYDISSAYPYQAYLLPCLIHGTWSYTRRRKDIESARLACIHYGLSDITSRQREQMGWGPFPYRTPDGSIFYPAQSAGGWVWKDEFIAAESWYPHVQFREAWCYHTDCDCRPFKDIATYYLERLRIGKEGAGLVYKNAINSNYGKLAQSVGRGPFNNWIWAGNITSGTRAQLITAQAMMKNPWNMMMIATDGIQSTEDIVLPKPLDTGTDIEVIDQSTGKPVRKPLGGWERKVVDRGVFYARPGVYFPMDPTEEELKVVRARGIGRGVILKHWRPIVDAWEDWAKIQAFTGFTGDLKWPTIRLPDVNRFCGAKTSISRSKDKEGQYVYHRADGKHVDVDRPKPNYGQWINRQIVMTFNPMPKRAGLHKNGSRLRLRFPGDESYHSNAKDIKLHPEVESAPYHKAVLSQEARELIAMNQELTEQPDGDHSEYGADF